MFFFVIQSNGTKNTDILVYTLTSVTTTQQSVKTLHTHIDCQPLRCQICTVLLDNMTLTSFDICTVLLQLYFLLVAYLGGGLAPAPPLV